MINKIYTQARGPVIYTNVVIGNEHYAYAREWQVG